MVILPLSLCLALAAFPCGLSFHIYDRPVMCTQDRWGTERWPLLPWQLFGELEERMRDCFSSPPSYWLDIQVMKNIWGVWCTKRDCQCSGFPAASGWTSPLKLSLELIICISAWYLTWYLEFSSFRNRLFLVDPTGTLPYNVFGTQGVCEREEAWVVVFCCLSWCSAGLEGLHNTLWALSTIR